MKLLSAESIRRPEVLRWHRRMIERYTPPPGLGLTVLLPCSAKKPYSKSKSHMGFRRHIRSGAKGEYPLVHEAILTSPLGLVPRELEDVYPAAHYDVPVTGVWSEEEKEIAVRLLRDYLEKTKVTAIGYAEGAYKEICIMAGVNSFTDDLSELEELVEEMLEDKGVGSVVSEKVKKARAVCDFQFGRGVGNHLFNDEIQVRGFQVSDSAGALIATFDRDSGFLALSLKGAERLFAFGRYVVKLSFKPETGSIFCAGIEGADSSIRPRDEVIATYKGTVIGSGKAVLSGTEMERAHKGLGIMLRHRSK
jgi:archaeosine synthase